MELIGIISSVVAAIAAVITLWFAIRNSKGEILKRIEKKENKIRRIEHQLILKYGLNRGRGGFVTPLDEEKSRLQAEIVELRRKL